jgi:hypothetical protein
MPDRCIDVINRLTPIPGRRGYVRTLTHVELVARVVHEEQDNTRGARRGPNVLGRVVGGVGQTLVDCDARDAELGGLPNERLTDARRAGFVIVEPPAQALDGCWSSTCDRVLVGEPFHSRQRRLGRATRRSHLPVEDHPFVMAQRTRHSSGLLHHAGTERVVLHGTGDARQYDHVRVTAEEHFLEEVLDREAVPWVVLSAVALRAATGEGIDLGERLGIDGVIQQMALRVEGEFAPAECAFGG